jgi:hypothetical protein
MSETAFHPEPSANAPCTNTMFFIAPAGSAVAEKAATAHAKEVIAARI